LQSRIAIARKARHNFAHVGIGNLLQKHIYR